MATLREIKRRIVSVEKTKDMTAAMKTVSAVKVRNAQVALFELRPYASNLAEIIARLSAHSDRSTTSHTLLESRPVENSAIIVMTSDRGLCGSFNSNIIRDAELFIKKEIERTGKQPKIIAVGRKGRDGLKKLGYELAGEYVNFFREMSFADAQEIGKIAIDVFLNGEVDKVVFLYHHFWSLGKIEVSSRAVLPIDLEDMLLDENVDLTEIEKWQDIEYIYEPDKEEILENILPLYLNIQVWRILQEHTSSEHGARMIAMETATSNCEDILKDITLVYNKARQASITREIIEVAAGSDI